MFNGSLDMHELKPKMEDIRARIEEDKSIKGKTGKNAKRVLLIG